jgi:hypothetical protein
VPVPESVPVMWLKSVSERRIPGQLVSLSGTSLLRTCDDLHARSVASSNHAVVDEQIFVGLS